MQAAFTMAEVLITLGIIGIIAALTIPNLMGKYKKIETVTKLKKSYTVLSQMVLQSQEDNGPASFSTQDRVDAAVVENFAKTYWFPYFNSATVAPPETRPYGTGLPYKFLNGNQYGLNIYTNYPFGRFFFTTNDGASYFVFMMTWDNNYDDDGNLISQTARYSSKQTVYVDLNGIKAPNTLGKDVFLFAIDFDKNTVKAYGYNQTPTAIKQNCKTKGEGMYCAAKIMMDGWEMKDDYPW